MFDLEKAMKKIPEKTYYRIGEVARITGVKPYVLRFWESEFKAIVPPKSRSQQRMYRRRDIETILLIKHLLYEERFTIEGARKRLLELARGEETPAPPVAVSNGLEGLRAELLELRELLASA
jgi:DNA-binding transcriptional MerR regulator